jgi:hypothetical protein
MCVLLAAGAVGAQARFESVAHEAVAGVPGLEIVIVHDRTVSSCYTLFLFQPRTRGTLTAPVDAATLDAAAAERNRRLDALSADVQGMVETVRAGIVPNPLRSQLDGQKVLADFEQVAREAMLTRIDARLAEIAAALRLAVAGPTRCQAMPPVADPLPPGGRP